MHFWVTQFQIIKPLPNFPVIHLIGCESQNTPEYIKNSEKRGGYSYCTFQYTLNGFGIFKDSEREHLVPEGSGFLVKTTSDASFSYYYPEYATEPWEFLYIEFSGPGIEAMIDDLLERNGPCFRLPLDGPMVRKLLTYKHYAWSTIAVSATEGAELIFNLLTSISSDPERKIREQQSTQLIKEAMNMISRYLASGINVTDLAARLGHSREHLTRLFRKHLDITPFDYITRQRLDLTRHLLTNTPANVEEIAEKTGYGTVQNLSRAFKRKYRISPSEYRKQHNTV